MTVLLILGEYYFPVFSKFTKCEEIPIAYFIYVTENKQSLTYSETVLVLKCFTTLYSTVAVLCVELTNKLNNVQN